MASGPTAWTRDERRVGDERQRDVELRQLILVDEPGVRRDGRGEDADHDCACDCFRHRQVHHLRRLVECLEP
jgi:hypothetical protein